jgi:uncharacterized protein (TIGR00266 family)
MQHAIEYGPAFAWLKMKLAAGETVRAEAGAMVRYAGDISMKSRLNAGFQPSVFRLIWHFLVALMRKLVGGETMFINDFTSQSGGEVVLAPTLAGNIMHKQLGSGQTLFVQTGGYLASTGSIDTKLRFGGLRTLFGGEGLVLLECSGIGDLFVNSYGGVIPVQIDGRYIVDTGHIVAFDGNLDFKVRSVGGVKSFLFSGEGLVCEFSGKGTVYIQSRNVGALVNWVIPLLPG